MNEVYVLRNMLALAKSRKSNPRSLMLRMIMPFLSKEGGKLLEQAISHKDAQKFEREWDNIRKNIVKKLEAKASSGDNLAPVPMDMVQTACGLECEPKPDNVFLYVSGPDTGKTYKIAPSNIEQVLKNVVNALCCPDNAVCEPPSGEVACNDVPMMEREHELMGNPVDVDDPLLHFPVASLLDRSGGFGAWALMN